ncbi:(2Fe-2S)-binding protein [Pseudomonas mandelii]|uniref:Ferric siderophore reductase C-terminal domain-containing protein n=1 Tax=Pseudomonas mandelii TaxID=75612 RepID=A0A502HK88_9PSED|nr:hypothetical protein EAH74_32250 [Pseudomonas mandelii]
MLRSTRESCCLRYQLQGNQEL